MICFNTWLKKKVFVHTWLKNVRIVRDTITYSAAISACEKGGKVERAG